MTDYPLQNCKSCGAAIIWAETLNGKNMPVDARVVEDGNIKLEKRHHHQEGVTKIVALVAPHDVKWETEETYTSHFATCPNADEHRATATATQEEESEVPTEQQHAIREEHIVTRGDSKFVKFAGLLLEAHERWGAELGINTEMLREPNEMNNQTAVFKAEVQIHMGEGFFSQFSAHGDANPGNVGRAIVPHIIRMAETRAIARALRFALGIDMAAVEELYDEAPASTPSTPAPQSAPAQAASAETHDEVMSDIENLLNAAPQSKRAQLDENVLWPYATKSLPNAKAARQRINNILRGDDS